MSDEPINTTEETKVLTNADILASQGLVEITDPVTGAKRQVRKAEAEAMLKNLEEIKKQLDSANV